VNLFHGLNNVIKVLDDVVGYDFSKLIVRKRPWLKVEIMHYVRICVWSDVKIESPGSTLVAAT
jgi:hypothetical protein